MTALSWLKYACEAYERPPAVFWYAFELLVCACERPETDD